MYSTAILTFLPIAEKEMLSYYKTYKSNIFCVRHTQYITQYNIGNIQYSISCNIPNKHILNLQTSVT